MSEQEQQKRVAAAFRMSANREGLTVGYRRVGLRASWRNFWIGARYTSFLPLSFKRIISIQLIPCVAVQICWGLEGGR